MKAPRTAIKPLKIEIRVPVVIYIFLCFSEGSRSDENAIEAFEVQSEEVSVNEISDEGLNSDEDDTGETKNTKFNT